MERKEIESGNKIIAKFMRYEITVRGKRFWLMDFDQLHFHESFDWIMAVVDKIEKIENDYHGRFGVHIVSNTCTIQATNFRPEKRIPDPPHYFRHYTMPTKNEATWLAVVDFIKWHNELLEIKDKDTEHHQYY